jgi:hypothetical protein
MRVQGPWFFMPLAAALSKLRKLTMLDAFFDLPFIHRFYRDWHPHFDTRWRMRRRVKRQWEFRDCTKAELEEIEWFHGIH